MMKAPGSWPLPPSFSHKRAIGRALQFSKSAEERRQLAEAADFCVQWIKVQGLKVAHIEGTVEKPCIVVKYRSACDLFEGIIHAYERGERGEKRYAYVSRFGCVIKWAVPAENPHKVEVAA